MRANLPAREPEILARWKAEGLYRRLLDAHRGGRALHAARRAALRERQRPPRHGAQQDHQGRHRQAPVHGRPPRALRPGLGLPRHADRAPGAARPRPRGAHHVAARDPPPLPRVRRQVLPHPARAVSAPRRARRLGRPVPDHVARVRGEHHPHVSPPRRARLHLSRPAPGAVVHGVLDGARRSRGRVRRPHLAVDLRALPADRERRRGRGAGAQPGRRRRRCARRPERSAR